MLGVALNAQRAGWGEQPFQVNIPVVTVIDQALYQTPSFSILTGVGGSPPNATDIIPTGNFDLTDYDLNTGFNNKRSTIVATMYADWPTGLTSEFAALTWANELKNNGTIEYFNINLQNDNGNMIATPIQGNSLTLGPTDSFIDRWLTLVCSTSETQSSFTNWTPPAFGSGDYVRMAVYDTETGELLGKIDNRATVPTLQIENWPATTPANHSGSYGITLNSFGSGTSPNFYNTRLCNYWACWGTMFDPLTESNTSWLTTRPSAQIGNAVAWINAQWTNDELAGSVYFVSTSGQDLYSQADDRVMRTSGWSTADWAAYQSTTIIPKDES